jgi:amino acid adenylation domain-containing protein
MRDAGPDSYGLHSALCLELANDIEPAVLAQAIDALVARHAALRTTFEQDGDDLWQIVRPSGSVPINDLPRSSSRRRDYLQAPFDLENGPIVRVAVFRDQDGIRPSELMIVAHHIAVDGWSLNVLSDDLASMFAALSDGRTPSRSSGRLTLVDLAACEQSNAAAEEKTLAEAYWSNRLEGAPQEIRLPTAGDPQAPRLSAGSVEVPVPAHVAAHVTLVARRTGVSEFVVYLTALQITLSRWCNQADVIVGVAAATRQDAGSESLVGPLVDVLPCRLTVDETLTFDNLLKENRYDVVGAIAHAAIGFDGLLRLVDPDRTSSRPPLVQVVMNDLRSHPVENPLGRLVAPPRAEFTDFDLEFELSGRPDSPCLEVTYARRACDDGTANELARSYVANIERWCADAGRPLALDEAAGIAPGAAARSEVPAFTAMLLDAASRWPGRPAVVDGATTITYAQLVESGLALARRLRDVGVGVESPVAVLAPRSVGLVIGLVGSMLSGGVYLPLDPSQPQRRLRRLLADSGAAAVVAVDTQWGADLAVNLPVLDPTVAAGTPPVVRTHVAADCRPDALAYTIFTSGSSGTPKAVDVSHGGFDQLISWYVGEFGLGEEDRVPLLANPAFDASLLEIAPTLAAGACVVVVPDHVRLDPQQLANFVADHAITTPFIVTPLFTAVASEPRFADCQTLRSVQVGGDRLTVVPAKRAYRLANLYGPTETTVVATAGTQMPDEQPHIGTAIAGATTHVLDRYLRPVTRGAVGELYIGGRGIARGYKNSPAATAAAFIPNPFGPPGSRMYRTGDLVAERPDGTLDYHGRRDDQIALRGHRIERAEIETALLRLAGVREAAVDVERSGAAARLVAHVLLAPDVTAAGVLDCLRHELPNFMIPTELYVHGAWPLTPSGKVDRRRLAESAPRPVVEEAPPPRGAVAEVVAGLWLDLLGRLPSGTDDFFTTGGHSLLAARLASRITERLGIDVPLSTIFERSRLQDLADYLEGRLLAAIRASS